MDDIYMTREEQQNVWGPRKNCPKTGSIPGDEPSADAKKPQAAKTFLSRAPAERRLGDRSLSSQRFGALAVVDAHASGGRPKQFCMGFRDFDPQQVGFRVEANETPSCRSGETLFSTTRPDGSPITATAISAIRWRQSPVRARTTIKAG